MVPHSQSELVQVTQGQILTTGREHAAHRCTGFPFVLHGHPGGMEKHCFRWDTSLNFYSAAEHYGWIRISYKEDTSPFFLCPLQSGTNPPLAVQASSTLPAAWSPLNPNNHLPSVPPSPLSPSCLQQWTPLPGLPVFLCLQPPTPVCHQAS